MKKQVIVVAGGSGQRMGGAIPKQFIEIKNKPILMWTIDAFRMYDAEMDIILVLPKHQVERWNTLCKTYCYEIKHTVVVGGESRFESVKNGLQKVSPEALVAIHDGVRPFVSLQTLERCFKIAAKYGTAVPYVDVVESLRMMAEHGSKACDRSLYKIVQTPQIFRGELILKAYEQPFIPIFTDDATVVEQLGISIQLVEGNRENIKITTPSDLQFAKMLFERR